jgi:6-pyruvoyltetrahydropterin/6-carboxytetrahydropterin synthase
VTGFVVDLKWLKAVIEREVLDAWDHRHLNLEAPEFAQTIPTTENLAIAAWRRLGSAVTATVEGHPQRVMLSRVRIYETPEIFAEYRGGL